MLIKIVVLKNFSGFTVKHLGCSLFLGFILHICYQKLIFPYLFVLDFLVGFTKTEFF